MNYVLFNATVGHKAVVESVDFCHTKHTHLTLFLEFSQYLASVAHGMGEKGVAYEEATNIQVYQYDHAIVLLPTPGILIGFVDDEHEDFDSISKGEVDAIQKIMDVTVKNMEGELQRLLNAVGIDPDGNPQEIIAQLLQGDIAAGMDPVGDA